MILLIDIDSNIIVEKLDISKKSIVPNGVPPFFGGITNSTNTCCCFGEKHVYCLLVKKLIDYGFDPDDMIFKFCGNTLDGLIKTANCWCSNDDEKNYRFIIF